ncbi:TPA: hypothetical protein N0F65_000254 [Lagenidium giganteum]|uniref:Uncharacterized protein n=1 Tax=Lagenidium giganteum TaxID=4803 RepID=A0AAV2Z9B3_9STRA|nr:TPA: hypothetical protein N0F65_000254 [Lagenidium giganteum]
MSLKSRLRAAWVSYMQEQLRFPTFRPSVLAPKREDVVWQGLSMNVIAGGFKRYAKPLLADFADEQGERLKWTLAK